MLVQRFTNNCLIHAECGFECSAEKNVGVAGYVEAFSTEQSDSQASVWGSYFENAVLASGY